MVNKQESKNEMQNKFWFQLMEMHATTESLECFFFLIDYRDTINSFFNDCKARDNMRSDFYWFSSLQM